jgi:uncharacterized protein YbjT (DUF2867 family)
VRRALESVHVAYYLIHSLGTGACFEQRDRDAAAIFANAAMSAGVTRIVYLCGVVSADGSGLSPHQRSRAEVGDILLGNGVPVAALQAAVIIGSGSASFEMLRYLTERLPVMVTPKWVEARIQPIAVHDVLRYLVGCAALPPGVSRRFDIGGPDVLTYAEMMPSYSEIAGLRSRVLLPVPLVIPRLSSLWVGLVTPVPAGLASPGRIAHREPRATLSRTTPRPRRSRAARSAAATPTGPPATDPPDRRPFTIVQRFSSVMPAPNAALQACQLAASSVGAAVRSPGARRRPRAASLPSDASVHPLLRRPHGTPYRCDRRCRRVPPRRPLPGACAVPERSR